MPSSPPGRTTPRRIFHGSVDDSGDSSASEQTPVAITAAPASEQELSVSVEAARYRMPSSSRQSAHLSRDYLMFHELSPTRRLHEQFSDVEAGVERHPLTVAAIHEDEHTIQASENLSSEASMTATNQPWNDEDARLQQENREDEDEHQMREEMHRMELRSVTSTDQMDDTPPREGRFERLLRG